LGRLLENLRTLDLGVAIRLRWQGHDSGDIRRRLSRRCQVAIDLEDHFFTVVAPEDDMRDT
jgi:hypothetical protein